MALPTREQAEIFEIIANLGLKIIFSLVVIVLYIILFAFIINTDCGQWQDRTVLASLEAVLTPALFYAFKHFFPNRDGLAR